MRSFPGVGADKQRGHHGISHRQWWAPVRVSLFGGAVRPLHVMIALVPFQDAQQPSGHDGCHRCGGHWLPRQSRSVLFQRDDHMGQCWETYKRMRDIVVPPLTLLWAHSFIFLFSLCCIVVYLCVCVFVCVAKGCLVLRVCWNVWRRADGCEMLFFWGFSMFVYKMESKRCLLLL